MSRNNPRLLGVEDDGDKAMWVARVESMSVLQVDEFKEFVKRRNGKAQLSGPAYSFSRRRTWMLMEPLRRELEEYTLKLDLELPPTPQKQKTTAAGHALPQQARKPRTFHSFKPIELSDEEEEDIKPTLSDLAALSHPSSVPPLPRFPSDMSILEISDDSISSVEQAGISNRKRKRKPTKARCHTKRRPSTPAPPPESSDVEVSGSESPSSIGDAGPQKEALGKETGKRVADTRIPITRQRKAEKLVALDYLPSYYPIQEGFSPDDVAFLIQTQGRIKNGSMESALKDQDLDSWGTGRGTTTGSKSQAGATNVPLLKGKARCSRLACQGTLVCEHFRRSPGLYPDGFSRTEANGELWAKIEKAEMDRKGSVAKNTTYWSAVFVRSIANVTCIKKGCQGTPIIRNIRSNDGWFVGCSKWTKWDKAAHMAYFPMEGADKDTVQRMMAGEVVEDVPEGLDYCFNQYSPRSGRTHCDEVHFVNGRLSIGKLVKLECPVRRISYTPYDNDNYSAVVMFEHSHNHPAFPEHKLTTHAQQAVDDAYEANGYGAQSTRAITGGLTLQQANPSLQNKRHLRTATARAIERKYTHGTGWEGVVHAMIQEQDLPREERYIWVAQLLDDIKILVTMLPSLAIRLHEAQEIVCDFTFKRVFGEMNEWEVAIWDKALDMRLTVARIYSNATNTTAFTHLWKAFFDSVMTITGRSIELQMLHGRGSIAFVTDAEAAQALGLAQALMTLPGVKPGDWNTPEDILPYVLVTCKVHFNRNLHKLKGEVSNEEFSLLASITSAATPEAIERWEAFCRQSPSKRVKDWFENKLQHSWYIPSLNPLKTKIRPALWSVVRHDSNIVESAHVSTNDVTGTGLPLLHAIERARMHDEEVSSAIDARIQTGIRPALHNTDLDRTRTRNRRNMKTHLNRLRNTMLGDALEQLNSEKRKNKEAGQLITRRTKELLTRGKDMSDEELISLLEFAAPPAVLPGESTAETINNGDTLTAPDEPQLDDPDNSYFPPHVTSYIIGMTDEEFSNLADALTCTINPD